MPIDGTALAARYLEVIEEDIIPLTRAGVAAGNKVFGAAILRKSDLSLVIAGTNGETANPLWHGEIHTLTQYYARGLRHDPRELLFLSTHEPCTMCLSAITWAGFDNFAYLFSHEDSRDAFAIPHDLAILKEVFGLEPGGYHRTNAFWQATAITDLVAAAPAATRAELGARCDRIRDAYATLSQAYQAGKGAAGIPLR